MFLKECIKCFKIANTHFTCYFFRANVPVRRDSWEMASCVRLLTPAG